MCPLRHPKVWRGKIPVYGRYEKSSNRIMQEKREREREREIESEREKE
jgi:hypothetical protein